MQQTGTSNLCATNPTQTWQLTADAQAPRAARDLLTSAWCAAHHRALLDDALLLVSEVVTNAVMHGGPPITLHVEFEGAAGLLVSVKDGEANQPTVEARTTDALGGRGMVLVDAVADEWGVESLPEGKRVWFRLAA